MSRVDGGDDERRSLSEQQADCPDRQGHQTLHSGSRAKQNKYMLECGATSKRNAVSLDMALSLHGGMADPA